MPDKPVKGPSKISTVSIDLFADGQIVVRDFPNEANAAVNIMNRAAITVALHFIKLAASGNITKEPQRIIRPEGVNPNSLKVVH